MNATERPTLTSGIIIDAALRCFARDGVADTSLQDIATELGVTKAAIYHHHASKREIIELALAPAFDTIAQILEVAYLLQDPRTKVEAIIAGMADQAVRHRDRYRIMLGDMAALRAISGTARYQELFFHLQDQLESASTDPTIGLRVSTFLLGLMAPATNTHTSELSDDELRTAIARIGRELLLPPLASPTQ